MATRTVMYLVGWRKGEGNYCRGARFWRDWWLELFEGLRFGRCEGWAAIGDCGSLLPNRFIQQRVDHSDPAK